jgi:putative N6-adenine-specific DNA methylase
MQETLAAAIITYTGWNTQTPLWDPMCGSGTLLCEGLIQGANIPPGVLRSHFGFEHLPDFNPHLWVQVRQESENKIKPLPQGLIRGSDMDEQAVCAAQSNCRSLPGGKRISLCRKRFEDTPGLRDGIIVCNPPYGHRLQDQKQVSQLLDGFGRYLRERCSRSTAYVYLGSKELHKDIPLSPAWTKNLANGGLQGCLAKYKIK